MRFASAVFILLVVCSSAEGQTTPPDTPPAGTTPAFVIQSDNGDNRLQVGAFVHMDGRFLLGDPQQTVTDSFVLRRFRTILQGRVARYFDYYLNVDFAGNAVNLRDAQMDTRFADALRLRVGKFKTPFSYDRLTLLVNILFVERGLSTTVAPDRDTGIQALGDVAHGRFSYAAAVTNGVVDGGNSDADANNAKDFTTRLAVMPWANHATHRLAKLGAAVAVNTGIQAGALPTFVTSGRQVFFSYTGATADGRRTRWSPQAFYTSGPFWGYGEYVRSRGGVRNASVRDDVDHDAWQVAASWVITGETVGERNVRPRVNFDPPSHHWGALQLAARYQALTVSENAIALGFATPGSSREARAFTLGANWYLNPFVKWNLNFERTDFDEASARHSENALLMRAHIGF